MFITPEYENILLSSSPAGERWITPPEIQDSQQLGGGRLYNVSERHDVYNVGVQQGVGSKVRLDLSYWYRNVKNAADQDQFFNTGIVFPLNFESGTLQGWNARLDLAPVLGGLRGYVSVGHVKAQYCNPFVGGLFLDTGALDTLGRGLLPDRPRSGHPGAGRVFLRLRRHRFLGGVDAALRLGSRDGRGGAGGRPLEPRNGLRGPVHSIRRGPAAREIADVWNFSLGARLQKYGIPLELQVDLLNAFDAKGLYNFQSVFGGTHAIPPRTIAGRVKYIF